MTSMYNQHHIIKRGNLIHDLIEFHERRAAESETFHEPEARHHRERAEKLRVVLANIESTTKINKE
jgi:diphthamide synthase (EF-2-diphthine--ammonia ligase)